MGVFDHFFSQEALEKEKQRGRRSASDVRVEREIERQDALRTDPTLIKTAMGSDETVMETFDYAAYCRAFHESMAQPLRFTETERTPGQPGYCTYKQHRAAITAKELEASWQEKQRLL